MCARVQAASKARGMALTKRILGQDCHVPGFISNFTLVEKSLLGEKTMFLEEKGNFF